MTARNVRSISIGLVGLLMGFLVDPTEATDAQEVFNDLYGEEVAAVRKTTTPDDDIALGWDMLRDAEISSSSPDLVTLLCNGAFDLAGGANPDEQLLVSAMTVLAENNPAQTDAARARLADHWKKRYLKSRGETRVHIARQWLGVLRSQADSAMDAGQWEQAVVFLEAAMPLAEEADPLQVPEVRVGLARVQIRTEALALIEEHLAELEDDPDNAELRDEVLLLYLLAMDDPDSAMHHLESTQDLFIQTYLPLARKDPSSVSAQIASELLTWYDQLTEEAPLVDAYAMSQRRVTYIERALTDDGLSVDRRSDLEAQLQQSRESLALSGMDSLEADQWTDLVDSIDLQMDRLEGTWAWDERDDYLLSATSGRSRMALPVVLTGSYSLKSRLMRMKGTGAMMVVLPVGQSAVMLQVDEEGHSGLDSIDGKGAADNDSSTTDLQLEERDVTNVEVSVQVEGDQADIRVKVDGRSHVKWQGDVNQLSAPSQWSSDETGRIVLGSNGSQFAFQSVQIKPFDDGAKRIR